MSKKAGVHPSHKTRSSDSSHCDLVCTKCGRTDEVPGGLGKLKFPCPADILPDWIISARVLCLLTDTKLDGAKRQKTFSEEMRCEFYAPSINKARIKAKKILVQFQKDVRKKYKNNPRYQVKSVTVVSYRFSEIHKL